MSYQNHLNELEIISNPAKIWDILTDIEAYHEWNPFIKNIKGSLIKGNIEILISDENNNEATQNLTVEKFIKNEELVLKNKFLFPGIYSQKHFFKIEKINSKTSLLKLKSDYEGFLKLIFNNQINSTNQMFSKMLDALKLRVEK